MNSVLTEKSTNLKLTEETRALVGFTFGLLIMFFAVRISVVNSYDFELMRRGVETIVSGVNPWSPDIAPVYGFYNPPFSALFLWPLLFITPQTLQIIGGALLFAVIFYQKAWVAIAWFLTNSFIWVTGMGGIDMYIVGAGLLLLFSGDKYYDTKLGVLFRVLAFGFLMIKPQGGVFIIGFYVLSRRDWKAPLGSVIVYGLLFITMYPAWIRYLMRGALVSEETIVHSLWFNFGPVAAAIIAGLVIISRRWQYWQLGGALAGILSPYGMPGIPAFLSLSAVKSLKAIPVVIIFSGCLAALTWLAQPPAEITNYAAYVKPFLIIYHLSLFGLAVALAVVSEQDYHNTTGLITVNQFLKKHVALLGSKLRRGAKD